MRDTPGSQGNPDGKGGSPVLASLDGARHGLAALPAKQIDQVAAELFTSLFVLESEFRFQPVVGKTYYLYRQEGRFWLAQLGPQRLGEAVAGRFIGRSVLQPDLTWTLELAPEVAADTDFMAWLAARRAAFDRRMSRAERVDDVLPTHESRFSFYRRASAFGVAHSLGRSMQVAGIAGLSYDEARGALADQSAAAAATPE